MTSLLITHDVTVSEESISSGVSKNYFPFGSQSSMRVPSGSVTQVKRP